MRREWRRRALRYHHCQLRQLAPLQHGRSAVLRNKSKLRFVVDFAFHCFEFTLKLINALTQTQQKLLLHIEFFTGNHIKFAKLLLQYGFYALLDVTGEVFYTSWYALVDLTRNIFNFFRV